VRDLTDDVFREKTVLKAVLIFLVVSYRRDAAHLANLLTARLRYSSFFFNYNLFLHRLYACLRLACGWILWHIRNVDDGIFRRHVCEALLVCYVLQALTVLRAQFTDRHLLINWVAVTVLLVLAGSYASFRFRKGGHLIKVYELPTASTLR